MEIFFAIVSFLFWPIVIIGGIIWYFTRRRHRQGVSAANHKSYEIFYSPTDAMSQLYMLFGVVFFGITLIGFNRELSDPLSWQMIILITSIIALVAAYYFKLLFTLFAGLVGLLIWWPVQLAAWTDAVNLSIKPSVYLLGPALLVAVYYLLARLHDLKPRYKRFSLAYMILGLVFATIALFILSTQSGLDILQHAFEGLSLFSVWQASIGSLALMIIFLSALAYAVSRKVLHPVEMLFWPILVGFFTVINFLPKQELFYGGSYYYGQQTLTAFGIFWSVILNILLFTELLGLIFIGYGRRELWLINLGSVGLFIFIIVKYFDWFFSFLDKGLFFIGAGLLLFIVGGFMEKKRRSLIKDIKMSN
jgi:hypothetical protein